MKKIWFIALLFFVSCKKGKVYPFNENDQNFLNYQSGQLFRIIDTTGIPHTYGQSGYFNGMLEASPDQYAIHNKNTYARYYVNYLDTPVVKFYFSQSVNRHEDYSTASISLNGYMAEFIPDLVSPSVTPVVINGTTYNNVFLLRAYGPNRLFLPADTATIYHNRQYGFLQMVFPNGKKITRVL